MLFANLLFKMFEIPICGKIQGWKNYEIAGILLKTIF